MDLFPPAQSRVKLAIERASAEYLRRNGSPLPVRQTMTEPFWIVQANPGQKVDGHAYDEAAALMRAALAAGAAGAPGATHSGNNPFATVPSASAARQSAAQQPWWRRVFAHSTAAPPARPVLSVQAFDPYLRVLRDDQRFSGAAVHNTPVATVADLLQLESSVPSAMPATSLGIVLAMQARTVSGGGVGDINAGLPGLTGLMGGILTDIVHSQGSGLTIEQSLDIAIQQRNTLVRDGGSKTLISHWNKEIRDLLWIQRRMPI